MKKVTIKIEHHFDAAHRLENYDGPCANLHGHRWNVTIYAKGFVDKTGMLIDFKTIKNEIDKLDHKYLNDIVDFNPTAENIAIHLLVQFESLYLHVAFKVVVWESPGCSVEVQSDNY